MELKEWIGPEDSAEFKEWVLYTTYRLGQAANDNYAIGGGGWDNYALDVAGYMNQYSVEVNGRHLFTDNIHIVDRNANATALPKISPNNEEESYVVVANGITEDVVLATPQQQIDEYTNNEAVPKVAEAKLDAINKIVAAATAAIQQIDSSYAGQLSNMADSYTAKMNAITQNYDNSMTNITANYQESMRVITNTQCVLIDSYVNGTSWYRVYSDGWCEQGGLSTLVADYKTINLLVPYKAADYNIFKQDRYGAVNDLRYRSIYDVTATSFKFYNDYVYGASWRTEGHIDIENYIPTHLDSGT